MKLQRVRLVNFCQFRNVEVEFHPGFNWIRGPNQSGKSNLLTGVVGCLTGDFTRNFGVRDDNICAAARDTNAPAYVELEFEHRNLQVQVRRSLRPVGQRLIVPGVCELHRDRDIRCYLEELLGIQLGLLTDHVFVEQWRMFDFLLMTEARRAQAMQHLVGAEEAALVHRLLGEREWLPVEDASRSLRDVEVRLEQASAEVRAARQALDAAPVVPDRLHQEEEMLRRRGVHDELAARIMLVRGQAEEAAARKQRLDVELQALERALDEARALEEPRRAARLRSELRAQLATAEGELRGLVEPERPDDYLPTTAAGSIAAGRDRLRRLEAVLDLEGPTSTDVPCPECGAMRAGHRDLYVLEASDLRARLDHLENAWRRSRHFDDLRDAVAWRRREVVATMERCAMELAILPDVPEDVGAAEVGVERLAEQVARTRSELMAAAAEAAALERELSVLQATATDNAVSDADVALARDRLRQHAAQQQARRDAEMRLRVWEEAERQLAEQVATLRRMAATERRRAAALQHLREVRAVFHHSCLPRLASQECLQAMEVDMNEILASCGAPFRVEVADGLRLTVVEPDGTRLAAERLSGGMRVLLALAFRVVVNSMFAPSIGLLCLDEPTVGLDENHLRGLDGALEQLRERSRADNVQVLVVTHEQMLGRLFDRIIDLGHLLSHSAERGEQERPPVVALGGAS